MSKHKIHPDWKRCKTVEQLVERLAANASLYGAEKAAWVEDARSCFARAFEIAAEQVLTKEP
jgi:hypothetical protein